MNRKRICAAILLAILLGLAQVRHYGGANTLNAGLYMGCVGYEYRGDPGMFWDCGE